MCPYSSKRQQRPLNWQTGPSVATSASSFAYRALARLCLGSRATAGSSHCCAIVRSFRGLCDGRDDLIHSVEPALARAGADRPNMIPILLGSRHFRARKARSGTGRDGRDRPCSQRACPRRCNRRPVSRSGCSGRRPAARTCAANCSTVSPRNSREAIDLFGRNPDVARCARATGSAPRAGESQAFLIPG